MINRVEFHNYKALRDVSLDLERFTVLVGPNASGKTSVLEGLHYLSQLGHKETKDVFGGDDNLCSLATRPLAPSMSLACSGDRGTVDLDIKFDQVSGGVASISCRSQGRKRQKIDEAEPKSAASAEESVIVGPVAFLRLEVKALSSSSYSEDPIPQMEPDGKGLASVLAYIILNCPEDHRKIEESLRSVIPSVVGVRSPRGRVVRLEKEVIRVDGKTFTNQDEREYWGNTIEFHMSGAPRIPAHMASEGTLVVLGILTVLMAPNRPSLVLLDDIDRALHPKAQEHLVGLLRKLLEQNPELQIVATSHSPYLLHHLEPEEVRLTALKNDGSVVCGRLEEHPDFEKWKEEMTPGEFWSVVGEKWLVEARTAEQGT